MTSTTQMAQRVARQFLARKVVFDPDFIAKLRKDFLVLMKNSKIVKTSAQAKKWRDVMLVWRQRFYSLIYEDLLRTIESLPFSYPQVSRDDAKRWEQFVRKGAWSLYLDSQLPLGRADDYWSEEARFVQFQRELSKWDARVRRGARTAWKALNDFTLWYQQVTKQAPIVDVPVEEQTTLEGFQVLVKGYDREVDAEYMERFKEGLKNYKRRAATVLPLMLRAQLPLVLDFNMGIDKGGEYHRSYISINPMGAALGNPGEIVRTLAHEMGHHLYRTVLTGAAQKFWNTAISNNYGTLDLNKVLAQWGQETDFLFNNKIKRQDPFLYLQIEGLLTSAPELFKGSNFLSTMDNVREYLAKGGQAQWRVHGKPITGYAHKNPEEAFCEALGMLVAYGPRTVLAEVRSWLQTVLPSIKIAKSQS